MTTTNTFWIEYKVFYCQAHKKSIYYFNGTRVEQETMCWDCWRESNLKGKRK